MLPATIYFWRKMHHQLKILPFLPPIISLLPEK